jgi:hypothetical protein
MYPFSYTGLKIVHEQQLDEAMGQKHFSPESEGRGRGLRGLFKALLRHTRHPRAKEAATDCGSYLHHEHNMACEF